MRQKHIFLFWLPLFASWLLMTAEGPIISATINRLPNEVIMLAAQGIVISLSVTIESPIINLLATSTALVKDRASYLLVRRYTIQWMIVLTFITIIIAFTPVFDLIIVQLLGTPEEVARWVKPGMQIMTFWSAAIAWRRFLQGVLIHFGYPNKMAWGTAVRLIASAGVAIGLAVWTDFAGVIVGASSLMAGVIAEAIYATIATRPLLFDELSPDKPAAAGDPLTYKELNRFHLPLAGTSVMILLVQPLITSSLARLDNPTQSLAAWPVLFQILLVMRAAAFALPEAVIALTKGMDTYRPIRLFAGYLTLGVTGAMMLFTFTPLSNFYIFVVQDMTEAVGNLTNSTLVLYILFPGLNVIGMWLRGSLIHSRATTDVNIAMVINLIVTIAVLGIGLSNRWAGLPTAAAALNIAIFCEIIYLAWRTQRHIPIGLPFGKQWQATPTI